MKSASHRLSRRWRRAGFAVTAALLLAAPLAAADSSPRSCLRIDRVTAFAPRGEIYVEVQAACTEKHFSQEDPIIAYLEVAAADQSVVSEDVRIYSDNPTQRLTLEFRDLDLQQGDPVLVRLLRFGDIVGLQTIKVP